MKGESWVEKGREKKVTDKAVRKIRKSSVAFAVDKVGGGGGWRGGEGGLQKNKIERKREKARKSTYPPCFEESSFFAIFKSV